MPPAKSNQDAESPSRSDLLTSVEIAELLRVHPKQVYRLIDQGLPARRVGSTWRFVREEVLAWSATRGQSEEPSPPEPPKQQPSAGAAPPPLLAANGDVVIELLLAALVGARKPLLGFVEADKGAAFELLAERAVLMAGFHGQPAPSHIDTSRLARIHLVKREVGLSFSRARKLRSLRDLAGRRLASRAPTAGIRVHLEAALARGGVTLAELGVASTEMRSHRDAVCALARGEVDAALTTAAWAARTGMGFLRLATEPYDLVLHAEHLGLPWSIGVCETAQSPAFREALAEVAGYDPSGAGEIRYDFP